MTLAGAVSAVPMLLVVWAALVACFVGLMTYRAQLTRYEDAELFLAETENAHEAQEHQDQIVRRVKRVQPLVQLFGGAAGLLTASIVAIWVADAIRVLQETHSI